MLYMTIKKLDYGKKVILTLMYWSQVKEMVLAASAHFDQLSIIGWDVALTPDGPLAIEINSLPDVSFMHTCYGGIRKQYMIDPVQL